MKRKRKNKTLWVVLGCLLLGGVAVGVVSQLNEDNKKPEDMVALYTTSVGEAKIDVDEEKYDVKVTGNFVDGVGKELDYSYTLEVDGNEDFDLENVSLATTFTNFNEIVLTIEGHEGLINNIDLLMFASEKDVVTAKVYLGYLQIGKAEVGTGLKAYSFEPLFASDKAIKIKITSEDPEATFNLNSIIINAEQESEEDEPSDSSAIEEEAGASEDDSAVVVDDSSATEE